MMEAIHSENSEKKECLTPDNPCLRTHINEEGTSSAAILDLGKEVIEDSNTTTPSDQESNFSVQSLDVYERNSRSTTSIASVSTSSHHQQGINEATANNNAPGGDTGSSSSQAQIDQIEVILGPRGAFRSTSSASLREMQQPTFSSSAFSFVMTLVFILVVWLVVFMVFGSRGHAIAGIFIALFFVGILINTCFFKFYFRLRLFLGMNAALAAAEHQARLQNAYSSSLSSVKTEEPPPSYDSVDQSPPPYDLLKFYNKNSSTNALTVHTCPYCGKISSVFGLCNSCNTKIDKL